MKRDEQPGTAPPPGGRKQTEDALKQSEHQFRLLVQSVTDYAIFMLDASGRVASWNVGAQRIKGYRPEEIIGQHFSRFYTEEDRAKGEPQKTIDIAARDGRFEKVGWRVRKDGTRFLANVVVDAIRDDSGKIIGFAKITRDISEQREAQLALEQAREALFQSQKMEAIGQLTGGIAHDFNNILMAVLTGLELLQRCVPRDPKVTMLLDNAMRAAERGAAMTQRMLAFARRQELKPTAVDLRALIDGIKSLLGQTLGPSVTIETRFENALPAARVDQNRLELALLNLAVNARDAMPKGGPLLIAARAETVGRAHPTKLMPGHYVRLSITDRGEGMDEATLARATEPFFTTKEIGKGTGLGLPMVLGLAEQSGGRLVLKSRLGKGTTAELWLPVADEAAERSRVAPAETAMPVERPLVVLVVDDDLQVLDNTAALIEDIGHTVVRARSGAEALEIVRRAAPLDLLVTDQAMPAMSGLSLAEAVRAERPNLPVILATGYAEASLQIPVDLPRLTKPFRRADLVRRIFEVVAAVPSRPKR